MHLIKRGSEGEAVRQLQESLRRLGFAGEVDGQFGETTHHAVIALQVLFGEVVDGMVGTATAELIARLLADGWSVAAARRAR